MEKMNTVLTAKLLGVDVHYALLLRKQYLQEWLCNRPFSFYLKNKARMRIGYVAYLEKYLDTGKEKYLRNAMLLWDAYNGLDEQIASRIKKRTLLKHLALKYPIDCMVEFNKAGFAKCIFHEEKTPSMKYYRDSNTVYCFGCNTYGNAITVAMKIFGINYNEAIKKLSNYVIKRWK